MKKKLRILVAIMLIMVTAFGMNIEASAVTEPYDTTITRLADFPIYSRYNGDEQEFEIESMGITAKGNLIATFNVEYTEEYKEAFKRETGKDIDIKDADGIYKITRADEKTFKLS